MYNVVLLQNKANWLWGCQCYCYMPVQTVARGSQIELHNLEMFFLDIFLWREENWSTQTYFRVAPQGFSPKVEPWIGAGWTIFQSSIPKKYISIYFRLCLKQYWQQ